MVSNTSPEVIENGEKDVTESDCTNGEDDVSNSDFGDALVAATYNPNVRRSTVHTAGTPPLRHEYDTAYLVADFILNADTLNVLMTYLEAMKWTEVEVDQAEKMVTTFPAKRNEIYQNEMGF